MIRIIGKEKREIPLEKAASVGEIAEKLGISSVKFVFLLNGNPVTSDKIVNPEDELVFMEAFSGG